MARDVYYLKSKIHFLHNAMRMIAKVNTTYNEKKLLG